MTQAPPIEHVVGTFMVVATRWPNRTAVAYTGKWIPEKRNAHRTLVPTGTASGTQLISATRPLPLAPLVGVFPLPSPPPPPALPVGPRPRRRPDSSQAAPRGIRRVYRRSGDTVAKTPVRAAGDRRTPGGKAAVAWSELLAGAATHDSPPEARARGTEIATNPACDLSDPQSPTSGL